MITIILYLAFVHKTNLQDQCKVVHYKNKTLRNDDPCSEFLSEQEHFLETFYSFPSALFSSSFSHPLEFL